MMSPATVILQRRDAPPLELPATCHDISGVTILNPGVTYPPAMYVGAQVRIAAGTFPASIHNTPEGQLEFHIEE